MSGVEYLPRYFGDEQSEEVKQLGSFVLVGREMMVLVLRLAEDCGALYTPSAALRAAREVMSRVRRRMAAAASEIVVTLRGPREP